jgi:hypothetical protein
MFVRFRQTASRLQLSLVVTRRSGSKVCHEHVASLGSVPRRPSIADRIEFWNRLHQRLAKLSNRVDTETQAKILGGIHARVPMVTVDEQRELQVENAKADEQFWDGLHRMHAGTVNDHKGLAAHVAKAIAEAEASKAEARAKAARERVERIHRGENVSGGLGEPRTREDFEAELLAAGFTKRDLRRMSMLTAVHDLGEDVWEAFLQSVHASDHADRAAEREARACLKLFGSFEDPAERAELARQMLAAMKKQRQR